jgi:hypothetical protein
VKLAGTVSAIVRYVFNGLFAKNPFTEPNEAIALTDPFFMFDK